MSRRVFIPSVLAAPPALPVHPRVFSLSGSTMGTSWHVQLVATNTHAIEQTHEGIQAQVDQVVAQMSTWEADSDLSCFNQAAAGTWVSVPAELLTVLDYALFLAQQTRGAYDPAAARLVDLWGFGPAGKRNTVPGADAIEAARQTGGWRALQIRRLSHEILQTGDIRLDLSSIAKGFGVDQVARFLERQQISSYLIEIGGELRGKGIKPDQQPWWVSIEPAPSGSMADTTPPDIVALHGLAIATSGNYRQYFDHEGQRYSHTIDTRTGYPVMHSLIAVTVLHTECMVADALATALFVMGADDGVAYANEHHIAALFLSHHADGQQEKMSRALIAMLDES